MGSAVFLWAQRSFFFVLTLLVGWVIYGLALVEIDDGGRQLWPFLIIWVLASYVLLPRLNMLLARIYVPSTLELGVHKNNPVRALYEQAGFRQTHTEEDYLHYSLTPSAVDARSRNADQR
ncbi:hypothetical protein RCH07_003863 [Arthrobacter sp. CG_A4]|nr:hypothetical protein [Arthrobacter sp. CG_A4]